MIHIGNDQYVPMKKKKKLYQVFSLKKLCTMTIVFTTVVVGSCAFNIYSDLKSEITSLDLEVIKLEALVEQSEQFSALLTEKIFQKSTLRVKVTAYHPASCGINSDSDPNNTATMTRPISGKTVAISTKMVEEGWLGKEIYIEGYGMYIANDRLAKGVPGYQIDICVSSKKKAFEMGFTNNVLAVMVDREIIKKFDGGKEWISQK